MGAFLSVDGFFERMGAWAVTYAKTPVRLLGLLIWSTGILSALITNDAVCVLGAPLVAYADCAAGSSNTESSSTLAGAGRVVSDVRCRGAE